MAFTARNGKTQTVLSEINMIPFIDVVLVLLIIFMITAPVIQSGLEVNVPRTQVVNELTRNLLVVTIDAKETLYLQNVPVNINELPKQIKAQQKSSDESVYLRADGDVNWDTATSVIEAVTTAGIKNIVVVTQPLEKRR
ncbi:MAG TPA: biopolymer transporter ExbD [Terriglobia bacterium]|nr:biopolymer transporter ExbD [Terriglobia bacterium]